MQTIFSVFCAPCVTAVFRQKNAPVPAAGHDVKEKEIQNSQETDESEVCEDDKEQNLDLVVEEENLGLVVCEGEKYVPEKKEESDRLLPDMEHVEDPGTESTHILSSGQISGSSWNSITELSNSASDHLEGMPANTTTFRFVTDATSSFDESFDSRTSPSDVFRSRETSSGGNLLEHESRGRQDPPERRKLHNGIKDTPISVSTEGITSDSTIGSGQCMPLDILKSSEVRSPLPLSNQRTVASPKPTHFICIRVNNPDTCDQLIAFQRAIIKQNPHLGLCWTDSDRFHISLLVCSVSPDNIADAIDAFKAGFKACTALEQFPENLGLKFSKVQTFTDRVLYAAVNEPEASVLRKLNGCFHKEFCDRNIWTAGKPSFAFGMNDPQSSAVESGEFIPHLTILKTTHAIRKVKRAEKKKMRIEYDQYKDLLQPGDHFNFGFQNVSSLELVEIRSSSCAEGFYHVVHCEPLGPAI